VAADDVVRLHGDDALAGGLQVVAVRRLPCRDHDHVAVGAVRPEAAERRVARRRGAGDDGLAEVGGAPDREVEDFCEGEVVLAEGGHDRLAGASERGTVAARPAAPVGVGGEAQA